MSNNTALRTAYGRKEETMESAKKKALEYLEKNQKSYCDVSDEVFDHAETAFRETQSARAIINALKKEGFEVKSGLADMETAFEGRFGSGKPVIGILGEFDALSALSQIPGAFEKKPAIPDAPGHGCGHNLLGAGSLAAASAVKNYLETTGKSGTVVYFGCPAEENGSGKAFMARAGLFDELDAAVTWHPECLNIAPPTSSLANYQIKYRFKGISSHAAATPHLGRSALDAVELMNVGVQFLREHVIDSARIHYAITNSGGSAPNVVQAEAEVDYLIRAPRESQVRGIYERINKIAKGAAMMTETEVEIFFGKACYNLVPNDVIGGVLTKNMQELGAPEYTEQEKEDAAKINATLGDNRDTTLEMVCGMMGKDGAKFAAAYGGRDIYDFICPYLPINYCLPSSTDVGDVSWICPTSQIAATTMASGTPSHSWQITSQGKSSIAHKGLIFAGKSMAGAVIDMIDNPKIVSEAREELQYRLGGEKYESVIPNDIRPGQNF